MINYEETVKVAIPNASQGPSASLLLPAPNTASPTSSNVSALAERRLEGIVAQEDAKAFKATLISLAIVGLLVYGGLVFWMSHMPAFFH